MKIEIELTEAQYNALKWWGEREGADHNTNGEPFRPEIVAQTAVQCFIEDEIKPEMNNHIEYDE